LVVSQKLEEMRGGRKLLQVNLEIATKIPGGLRGGGLGLQKIFIDWGNPFIHLTIKQLDVRINAGETSSGGCQKEFKVWDHCIRWLFSKWKHWEVGHRSRVFIGILVKKPEVEFIKTYPQLFLQDVGGQMEFPRNSQRVKTLGRLDLGDKRLGNVLGVLAEKNTLGTPGMLKNPFELRLLLGVLFLWRKWTWGLLVVLWVRKDPFLQFVPSPASVQKCERLHHLWV